MNTDNKYNGWLNYETWCINLWITNDEGSDGYFRELAQEHYNNAEADKYSTKLENAVYSFQSAIKEYVEENNPIQDASLYSDLLQSAIDSADYYEIASNMLEDVEEDTEIEEYSTRIT